MIAVEHRFFVVHMTDYEDAHAQISFGVEAHPDFNFVSAEAIQRNALNQFIAVLAVTKGSGNDNGFTFAGLEAFDALFESRDDVARTM